MIETVIRDYLTGKFPLIPVLFEVPEDVPNKYIVLMKTSGSCENHIFASTFAVQSIAPTLYEAAELNEDVVEAMLDIDAPEVSGCNLNSNYNYTNTRTKEYRYQAVFDLTHY